ncbi:MAG: hypothetical protein KC486_02035 [Myxococcales bacterium]|nr:hypothetical protein [Myxococcales bacterium]
MAASAEEVLAKIPDLVRDQDAAALVGLADHDEKKVRKAVRKAIHVLKTKGVEIPKHGKSWTPGSTAGLRGDLSETAMVDVGTTPGLFRVYIAKPGAESNGFLFFATLTAFDHVVGFKAYVQTDGQRQRVLRDWERQAEGRKVPVEWAKARIRWARERTLSLSLQVPEEINQALIHLGDAPSERPADFVAAHLDTGAVDPAAVVDAVLRGIGANAWPPVLDVEPFLKKVTEAHPNITQETPEAEREAALLEGIADDAKVREALHGPLANLFADSAVGLWLNHNDAMAAQTYAIAAALRGSDEPEKLPWVTRIIGLQIASTIAYQQQQQMRRPAS